MVVYEMRIFSVGTLLGATTWITRFVNFWQEIETCWLGLSTVKRYFHMQEFKGVSPEESNTFRQAN